MVEPNDIAELIFDDLAVAALAQAAVLALVAEQAAALVAVQEEQVAAVVAAVSESAQESVLAAELWLVPVEALFVLPAAWRLLLGIAR